MTCASHLYVTGGCLLFVLCSLFVSSRVESAHMPQERQARVVRSPNNGFDLEALPPEIRQRIGSSRLRTSSETANVEPNCWVEIDVPHRVGGVCRRIENTPACSVNENLYVNHPDCM